jgi:hypothetical protein
MPAVLHLLKKQKGKPADPKIQSRRFPFFIFKILSRTVLFAEENNPNRSSRSSDSRITLLAAPSPDDPEWFAAAFIPSYSGGPVSDFHGIPYYALKNTKRWSSYFSALEQLNYYPDKKIPVKH